MSDAPVMPGALRTLNPEDDASFPTDHPNFTKEPPTPGSGIRVIYDLAVTGDGAKIREMYDAVRAANCPYWTTFDHWDGPQKVGNGIGLLRRYGVLSFTAATRKWKLTLKA